ncbi:glutathione S-transferase family protein [Variovorax sp. NFACC27]|uniref:Glutathione S-transferase family protein n=1 Tax=Variovorax gossypii TaxID=1679495 RepID=A0A431TDE3_9BURK|nr:glutathione S-transferase family protein [Variovorax gossypii]SEF35366.1 glutathione S-transferase [Variovorax sp. NFACC28]SEG99339.1 glutathione S-transferase [Variovorax sp. NFACC29]SFE22390.1 glutathione S-transferase [Variovorax sp. NFACC26]SFH27185.1 glutathione S-transferase [Variovorax sp. NFACC27]RTQ30684.1 glutathione S-transferase family protein [Variovorax gossypii]
MSFALYYHPLSSFCWKALIALYEADIAFEARLVNLGDPADRAAFQAIWPLAKFPVLRDNTRGKTIPESSVIIDYLARTEPRAASLVPGDPELAMQTRLLDRLIDSYIHAPFQQVVAERLRPDGQHDPFGVEQARRQIRAGYDLVAPMISGSGPWAMGESFTMADCAALPALFYADYAVGLTEWPELAAYLGRLKARPSVARVLAEAEPYFQYFPLRNG